MAMQCCVVPSPVIRRALKRGIRAGTYFPLDMNRPPDTIVPIAIHCGDSRLSLPIKKHIKESDAINAVV